jgi:ABC-type enterochelin transport system permease subunit
MNNVTELMRGGSAVRRGTILKRLFVIGYVTATAVAMVGWISAFGWLAAMVAKWLLA